ncbi:SPOR domain-containing protein [Ottowia oryzae]|uniref:Sporulation protein n=1 Tax=Ottowia oryzae TaxID=2109914 RepID=A0A2S0MJE7_9BURK|nr:SPOR domain-containing protein [Ottowia oryzae]AVO35986.1 sporulation protein [Ottowia oryzae]
MNSKQRGGTFLGIILGMMVGLAAALAVAIYVAKVPIPFVNKSPSRTSGQDAAEAEKNRDWDPNSPLRNRNAAKPGAPTAAGTVAPAPEATPVPAPVEVARPTSRPVPAPAEVTPPTRSAAASATREREREAKPATETATASATKPAAESTARTPSKPTSSDPLGDLVASRTGNAAPSSATADPFTYFVQAGAFRTQDDADAQRARLSLMGVEARVTEREQAGRTVYRVRVGPFQNKDAADRVKGRLDGNGFDSALVRVQR